MDKLIHPLQNVGYYAHASIQPYLLADDTHLQAVAYRQNTHDYIRKASRYYEAPHVDRRFFLLTTLRWTFLCIHQLSLVIQTHFMKFSPICESCILASSST